MNPKTGYVKNQATVNLSDKVRNPVLGPLAVDGNRQWVFLSTGERGADQKIMELSLGMRGHKPLSNLEIAKKLGRSPGALSQRKAKIQAMIDKEEDLSPFIG